MSELDLTAAMISAVKMATGEDASPEAIGLMLADLDMAGFVVVPKIPTPAMMAAMDEYAGSIAPEYAYEAAIAAAPK